MSFYHKVWRHAIAHKDVQAILICGAERFAHHSMFDSLAKITVIVRRCKMNPEKIKWVFSLMLDRCQEGYASVSDFSNTILFGTRDKKGQIDFLLSLLDLKEHLLTEVLPASGCQPAVVKQLQVKLGSPIAYRKTVPELIEGKRLPSGFSWMAGWTLPQKKLVSFVEGILYKNEWERQVKQNVANKRAASEVLAVTEVQEEFDAILAELKPKDRKQEELPASDEEQVDADVIMDEVQRAPAGDDAAKKTVKKYQELAFALVDQSVRFVVEPKEEKALADMLRDALGAFDVGPAVVEGRERTYDLGVYDVKACGEVTTHPHLRVMSFRSEHYLKCMRAFARAQLPAGADSLTAANVPDAMMGLLFDGGKGHGAPCENDSPCIPVCTPVCVSIRLPLPICMPVRMCVRVCACV